MVNLLTNFRQSAVPYINLKLAQEVQRLKKEGYGYRAITRIINEERSKKRQKKVDYNPTATLVEHALLSQRFTGA
jgi:hypothetical protein